MSKDNTSVSLMARRLGVYNVDPKIDHPSLNVQDEVTTAIQGVSQQSTILNRMGGHAQQERMIRDKQRTLDRALRYSYQGATVRDVNAEEDAEPHRALINPNKVKLDYDEKVISINWDANFGPGTVFKWEDTNTFWLIMYQDLTELAYFKGDCRKCHYTLKWTDKESGTQHSTYASVIGPKENVHTVGRSGASTDEANYTLNVLIPNTEATEKYFQRYDKFSLGEIKGFWRVTGADFVSTPGIIQLIAKEEYNTTDEVEENIVPEEEITPPQDSSLTITGEEKIRPMMSYTYTCDTPEDWSIKSITPQAIKVLTKNSNTIILQWREQSRGEFTIKKGSVEKTITVSLKG